MTFIRSSIHNWCLEGIDIWALRDEQLNDFCPEELQVIHHLDFFLSSSSSTTGQEHCRDVIVDVSMYGREYDKIIVMKNNVMIKFNWPFCLVVEWKWQSYLILYSIWTIIDEILCLFILLNRMNDVNEDKYRNHSKQIVCVLQVRSLINYRFVEYESNDIL